MKDLIGNAVFGQSGGPTSVINASAAGVFQEALRQPNIKRVFGAAHGIKGLLDEVLYDIGQEDDRELELLKNTPSSALGSVRYKLADSEKDDTDYKKILDVFKKYDIRYFFYNGGNDSMDTCNKISKYMQRVGYDCRVIGVPKTIDNDLFATDHCPGYGSAAKYVATTVMEVFLDARVYNTPMITVIEIMGRNAGWLTAASALAGYKGYGPDLIYLPEVPFTFEKYIADIDKVYQKTGKVIVAFSEGCKDESGTYIADMQAKPQSKEAATKKDSFGHTQLGGAAAVLAHEAEKHFSCKVRGIEFSLMQRCAAHIASLTDINEAVMAGREAVRAAVGGLTDQMVAFERVPGTSYQCKVKMINLNKVANTEKTIPSDWINDDQNHVKEDFIDYALPLIQGTPNRLLEDGLPRFSKLKKVLAKP